MSDSRVPTVDDLRVKLCYICREEERYGDPQEGPPRAWTHPCNCTLVAHESCLLQWIKAAQQNPDRAPNALKCPQCGAKYELESKNPLMLRVLDAWNKALLRVGRLTTVSCAGIIVISFGAGLYAVLTSYGAWALRNFIGNEMYSLLLSDDPTNWPWHAFLNLPFVPLSLIISRTPLISLVSPLFPLLFPWPTDLPWAIRSSSNTTPRLRASYYFSRGSGSEAWWPPTPTMVVTMFPFVNALYKVVLDRAHAWVIGERREATRWSRLVWNLNDPGAGDGMIRIRIGMNEDPEVVPAQGQGAARQQQPQQGQGAGARIRADQAPAANPNANPNPDAVPGPEPIPAEDDNANANDAGEAAERTIRLTGSSLGRLVAGALILPSIANLMGRLLLRLSHSPHIPFLSRILAARPPLSTKLPSFWGSHTLPPEVDKAWERGGVASMGELGRVVSIGLRSLWGGTRVWAESDPVWWRNTLGLGLFIVAKDAVKLLHLWLAKQELETRHVKNRTFEGVDARELDLIHPRQ